MTTPARLLGTTAAALAGLTGAALAGDITLPGALDLRISGDSDFEYEYIDSDLPQATNGRESFFNQDHEIVFLFTGVGDATGVTYGARLELELDTGSTSGGDNAQWDEAWGFVKGGWGEFRFGNEDSVVDLLSITGYFNNRGTGGLDGDQRTAREFINEDSGEATKIMYFTPEIAGFQGGINYAFNGDDTGSQAGTKDASQDVVELGLAWEGSLGGVDLGAFAGGSSLTPESGAGDGDRAFNYTVGGLVGFGGFSLAAGWIDNDDGASDIDYSINAGVAGDLAGIGVSFAFQQDELEEGGNEQYYVLSADIAILPGVALRGDVAYLDGDEDDGVNALVQLHTAW